MKLLGKGAFGQVYTAFDISTNSHVAIKIESPLAKKPVLKLEITVLRKVQDSPYFPRYYACGRFLPPFTCDQMSMRDNIHCYTIMELLGPR